MASLVLGIGGAVVGGPIGGAIGGMVGSVIDSFLFKTTTHAKGPRLADLQLTNASFGAPIPTVYGVYRVPGEVIWGQSLREVAVTKGAGGKGGGGNSTTYYTYYWNGAVAIADCQTHPIVAMNTIWADGKVLYRGGGQRIVDQNALIADAANNYHQYDADDIRVYMGTTTQLPDTLMQAQLGIAQSPAYRRLAYVVFESLDVTRNFASHIPNFQFEVVGTGKGYASTLVSNSNQVWATAKTPYFSGPDGQRGTNPLEISGGTGFWADCPRQTGSGVTSLSSYSPQTAITGHVFQAANSQLIDTQITANAPLGAGVLFVSPCPDGSKVAVFFNTYTSNGYQASVAICDTQGLSWGPAIDIPTLTTLSVKGYTIAPRSSDGHNMVGWAGSSTLIMFGSTTNSVGTTGNTAQPPLNCPVNAFASFSIDTHNNITFSNAGPVPQVIGTSSAFTQIGNVMQTAQSEISVLISDSGGHPWVFSCNGSFANAPRAIQNTQAAHLLGWGTFIQIPEIAYGPSAGWWFAAYDNIPGNTGPYLFHFTFGGGAGTMLPFVNFPFTSVNFASFNMTSDGTSLIIIEVNTASAAVGANIGTIWSTPIDGNGLWTNVPVVSAIPSIGPVSYQGISFNYNAGASNWILNLGNGNYVGFNRIINANSAGPLYTVGAVQPVIFQMTLGGETSVDVIVRDLCQLSGLTDADLDLSAVTDQITGYQRDTQMSARDGIGPLLLYSDFLIQESEGKLKSKYRQSTPTQTIDVGDLAARVDTDPIGKALTITRKSETETLREMVVNFSDNTRDYQTNSVRVYRNAGYSQGRQSVSVPVVMSAGMAYDIANRELYVNSMERTSIKFSLPWNYMYLDPGDTVNLSNGMQVRILSMTLGDGIIQFEAVPMFGRLGDPAGTIADANTFARTTLQTPMVCALYLEDLPPILDTEDYPGWYWCVSGTGDNWSGSTIYEAPDNVNFAVALVPNASATVGTTTTILGSGPGGHWDLASTVTVQLLNDNGNLESDTADNVLGGTNMCIIGSEVLQYTTATLIGTNTYTLSGLLRGRRGTFPAIATHVVGETFILLDTTNVSDDKLALTEVNQARYFKTIYGGLSVGDVASTTATNGGARITPLAPVSFTSSMLDTGDLSIKWIRQARINIGWNNNADVPLDEPYEVYTLTILSGTTVIRSLTITPPSGGWVATPTYTYLLGDQQNDYAAGGSKALTMTVGQVSSRIGIGALATITLPTPNAGSGTQTVTVTNGGTGGTGTSATTSGSSTTSGGSGSTTTSSSSGTVDTSRSTLTQSTVTGAAPAGDPTSGLDLVFSEDFNTLRVRTNFVAYPPTLISLNDSGFIWSGAYANTTAPDANGNAWATLNDEQEAYPNGQAIQTLAGHGVASPLQVANGVLTITASQMPAAGKALLPTSGQSSGATYLSGALDSYPYAMNGGYVEASMKMPPAGTSQGLWPAFWLLAGDNSSWPPEIDVVETISNNTNVFQSIHTMDTAWGNANNGGSPNLTKGTPKPNLSTQFNTYGVLVGTQYISFYFNRVLTYTVPIPSDMANKPMRLLLNLAVGGQTDWPGPPDSTTVFPSSCYVDYVRLWQ